MGSARLQRKQSLSAFGARNIPKPNIPGPIMPKIDQFTNMIFAIVGSPWLMLPARRTPNRM